MKENKMKLMKKAGSIAAVLAVAAGGFAYALPATYVSLDVNPSVEYSVNAFGRVLSVKAVNDDGEVIASELDVKNLEISKAVKLTIDKLRENGYIAEGENAEVVIAVSNSNEEKAAELAEVLEEETQEYVDETGDDAEVEAEAVGRERVEEARALGVTPGKLNIVQKLAASADEIEGADEIVIEEWLDKPVKDINKAIKENRKYKAADGEREVVNSDEEEQEAEEDEETNETLALTKEDKSKDKTEKSKSNNSLKNSELEEQDDAENEADETAAENKDSEDSAEANSSKANKNNGNGNKK